MVWRYRHGGVRDDVAAAAVAVAVTCGPVVAASPPGMPLAELWSW